MDSRFLAALHDTPVSVLTILMSKGYAKKGEQLFVFNFNKL